ncbi:MAG: hypothetical protein MN733_32715 [Nitrososphaera sp.]|nr:hypothetical protein [Nitrososphaera sp.]
MIDPTTNAEFEGLKVFIYRYNGRLLVEIDSTNVKDSDTWSNGVPKLRVRINEGGVDTLESGSFKELD